jgi:hypothetical protein
MIHASVTDELELELFPATADDCSSWDDGTGISLTQVAADGIALSADFDRTRTLMAPGYRIDIMA